MTEDNDLTTMELAALLSSKICHDIISPVGAIANGLELLDEDQDEETHGFAMELVKNSTLQATAKLKFARLAFGASGASGSHIDVKDAEDVSREYIDSGKIELQWSAPVALLPKDVIKLLLNLVLISIATIPRGGSIKVIVTGEGDNTTLELTSEGAKARIPERVTGNFDGTAEKPENAHDVQHYYAGKLAIECGMTVAISETELGVFIAATPG